jgi:uncharacterized repeat protein (TIGR01451 family)
LRHITWASRLLAAGVVAAVLVAPAGAGVAARLDDSADLGVTISAAPASILVGESVTYTVTATNAGPSAAGGVAASDGIAGAGATITSVTATQGRGCTVSPSKKRVRCELGTLASGASAQFTAVVATTAAGNLVSTASVTSNVADPNPANQQAPVTTPVTESDPPVDEQVTGDAFALPFQTRSSITLAWDAKDTGSGIAGFDVRYRTAGPTAVFGPYVTWQTAVTTKRASFAGRPGWSYCFSVRATDRDKNSSPWSAERCTSFVLGPAAAARAGAWSLTAAGGGHSASVRATARGAELRLAGLRAHKLFMLAVACPGCGSVQVLWNGKPLRTIGLRASTRTKRVFAVASFPALARGTLLLRVVSASGSVSVQGFGIAKV